MPESLGAKLRRGCGVLAATLAVLGAVGCAQTGSVAPNEARVVRLGALFAQALPIGWAVERIAAADPQWPFQKEPGRVSAAQLACTRAELTPAKVAVTQIEDAREFARRYPDRVDESIAFLEGGASEAVGNLMRYGMQQAIARGPKAELDGRDAMTGLSAAQLRGVAELARSNRYEVLRQAMHLDGLLGASTRQETRQRGVQLGQQLLVAPLLAALERCGIPPAQVF